MKYIKGICFISAGLITSIALSFINDLMWIRILQFSIISEITLGIYFIKQDYDKENSK